MVHVNHHHHAAHPLEERDGDVAEAVSVVYVTAAKTFAGPIAGYSTPSVPQATQAAQANSNNNEPNFFDGGASTGNVQNAPMAANSAPAAANTQPAAAAASTLPLAVGASSAAASQISPSADTATAVLPSKMQAASSAASSSAVSQQTTLVQSVSAPASASSSAAATHAVVANAQSAQAPTAAPQAPEQTKSDSGMSSGGKAGLAIGIIAIVAILAAVGFFFYRRKANNAVQGQQVDNEKSGPAPAGGMTRSTSVKAPNATRLSMRAGNEAVPQMNEKVAANGGMAPVAAPTTRGRTPEPEKTNPFGDHAKVVEPVHDAAMAPKPLNVSSGSNSRPTTPSSEKSATATAPPRGPDGQALNVHRVQLDFAPSMDDELELRQGQLVRMLHEYDDGWCLCVRLDRSQQGVCPRSCISKQPVKPRAGPAPGAKGPKGSPRPTTPQSQGSPRARASSNATPAPLNTSRPQTPQQGPFGDGEYRANNKSPTPSYEPSMLSNSPNQSPPSSPETKSTKKVAPGPGQAV